LPALPPRDVVNAGSPKSDQLLTSITGFDRNNLRKASDVSDRSDPLNRPRPQKTNELGSALFEAISSRRHRMKEGQEDSQETELP